MQTVGIVGVGKIGLPIEENLIKNGYRVLGYRRSSMADFEEIGGIPARRQGATWRVSMEL
jgi:3-hydroxyisobutyrate dehydrogenase-like beta-hydroxyacid dehydrogenase